MASSRPTAGLGLGLACLLVAAAAMPDLCPPHSATPSVAADAALTPLCQTQKLPRTSGLLTPVTCPTAGCRCHMKRPEMRCVPFNSTVTQVRGGVETKTSVTVACVCAIPG